MFSKLKYYVAIASVEKMPKDAFHKFNNTKKYITYEKKGTFAVNFIKFWLKIDFH